MRSVARLFAAFFILTAAPGAQTPPIRGFTAQTSAAQRKAEETFRGLPKPENLREYMRAITEEVVGFEMPGATMAGFRRNSMIIAKAGIYDLRLHHDDVIMPVLRHWDVFDRTDLGAAGEQARDELATFLTGLDAQASRFVERRAENRARVAARSDSDETPDIAS